MVEELLDFSKMEDGRFTLHIEETDLQAELEDAIFTYRELFRQDGIQLEYEAGDELLPAIMGDPERLKQVQARYYDTALRFNRFSVVNSSILSAAGLLVSYLCLGWGAYRLWKHYIDFGTMVLFIQLAGYLSSALSALIKLGPSAIECTVSAQRIMTIFDLPREKIEGLEAVEALKKEVFSLQLSGLRFSYQNRSLVLDDLSLSVSPHEMIAIVGPSGSGKTTLFRILLALLHPTDGTAELVSKTQRVPISPATRALFSSVPQDNVIFGWLVRAQRMQSYMPPWKSRARTSLCERCRMDSTVHFRSAGVPSPWDKINGLPLPGRSWQTHRSSCLTR